jgi:hypothetical protein
MFSIVRLNTLVVYNKRRIVVYNKQRIVVYNKCWLVVYKPLRLVVYKPLGLRLVVYKPLGLRLVVYKPLGLRLVVYKPLGLRLVVYKPLGLRLVVYKPLGLRLVVYKPLGKPTRLAPMPKDAPWRAVTPMLGLTTSRIAKTTAARIARVATSSIGMARRGISSAAAATRRPSIRYLITRLTISATPPSIIYSMNRKKFAVSSNSESKGVSR